jgi:hypothetical protein
MEDEHIPETTCPTGLEMNRNPEYSSSCDPRYMIVQNIISTSKYKQLEKLDGIYSNRQVFVGLILIKN